jgi:hypothetical protein
MRLVIPLQLEMDSDNEPPEVSMVTAIYCPTCFAVIPGHRLEDHQRAVHGGGAGQ